MTWNDIPRQMDDLLDRLFPLNRSLTGSGNRKTLEILSEIVPLEIHEYPSGTEVFDWTIPPEWDLQEGWIDDADGRRLIDVSDSNLHVMGYSDPIRKRMSFTELSLNLHTASSDEDAIPYRTSYYERTWGFCVSKKQFQLLEEAKQPLDVCIKSSFNHQGSMTVAELIIPGQSEEEYFVSTYFCHPSMANDNLSGLVLTTFLAKILLARKEKLEKSWRFIFVPETIGAISYLKYNVNAMEGVKGGFVASCCGGPGQIGYKETFLANHLIDRSVNLVFRDSGTKYIHYPFKPDGSDERQYSSPGFRIPTATISKDKYYEFEEYHTSLDNLEFVNGTQIQESLKHYLAALEVIDKNKIYKSLFPYGEVQLGKRKLYPSIGGAFNTVHGKQDPAMKVGDKIEAISWILFLADGTNDLVAIAERSGIQFEIIAGISEELCGRGLLEII